MRRPDPERLWPTPHSVIFDLEGSAASAGEIDAIAERARRALPAMTQPSVIAHCDWSLQNLAFEGGEIVAVFDWDSVGRLSEAEAVAGAAASHQQDWRGGPDAFAHDFYPGPSTALAFADAYARARARPWSASERRVLDATLVARLAYQARCEHALDPSIRGPALERLLRFARELLP